MSNPVTGRTHSGETLRLKVGLIAGLAMLCVFLFALGITSRLLLSYFGDVQDQISMNRLQSTATMLGQLAASRVKHVADHASASYIQDFLTSLDARATQRRSSSLGRFPEQDAVFLFDSRRQLVAAIRAEPSAQSVGSPGTMDLDVLAKSDLLGPRPVAGFTEENGQCMLLASCPVADSSGENLGWLVFGAYLSDRLLHDMESVSLGGVQIHVAPEKEPEDSVVRWHSRLFENRYLGPFEASFVRSSDLTSDADVLSARLSFRNLVSPRPIIFEFGLPANVYSGASKARDFIIIVALVSGVAFLGIVLISIEISVLRPLAALDREMQRMSSFEEGPVQLSEARGDEIGRLARSANLLLSKIASGREAAKDQRDLLQGVLNSTTEGVVAMRALRDKGGRIHDFEFIMVNQPAARFYGRSPQEMVGIQRSALQPPPGPLEVENFKSVILTRRPELFEQCYPKDGRNSWYHLSAAPWGDGIVVSIEDITDRKEREAALEQSMEELGRFNEAMIGREERIIELKKEINDLLAELGRPPAYQSPTDDV